MRLARVFGARGRGDFAMGFARVSFSGAARLVETSMKLTRVFLSGAVLDVVESVR